MAIGTPVILVAAYNTSDLSSYTLTPSPAPTRGRLLVCFSDTSHGTLTAPDSTPTGLGLVWTLRGTQAHPTDVRKIFAHTAPVSADLTSGDVTLTMTGANLPSTGTGHALVQMSGVDLANPVVRVVSTNANSTSVTVTLPKPLSVANRWLVFKSHRANEVTTPRAAPWSEISDVAGASPTRAANVQWLPGVVTSTGILETAASASWVTSGQASIIALEMRAAADRQFWVFDTVASSNVNVNAETTVPVSFTANQPATDIRPNAGNATVTATANNLTASIKPSAGVASVTFTANQPGMSNAVNLGLLGTAYVFVDVDDPTASIKVNAGVAAVSFTANQPTITIGGADLNVTPTAAAVTVTANQPTASLKVNAGLAT